MHLRYGNKPKWKILRIVGCRIIDLLIRLNLQSLNFSLLASSFTNLFNLFFFLFSFSNSSCLFPLSILFRWFSLFSQYLDHFLDSLFTLRKCFIPCILLLHITLQCLLLHIRQWMSLRSEKSLCTILQAKDIDIILLHENNVDNPIHANRSLWEKMHTLSVPPHFNPSARRAFFSLSSPSASRSEEEANWERSIEVPSLA